MSMLLEFCVCVCAHVCVWPLSGFVMCTSFVTWLLKAAENMAKATNSSRVLNLKVLVAV